jgi:chemotaxis family two-component system response regulator Rcp1
MMLQAMHRTIEILLVEDNPGDARLTHEALREAQLSHRLQLVTDGESALAYLRREGRYAEATRPDLVLLDLHLPRKSGWDVVAEMRRDDCLRELPVAILAGVPEEGLELATGFAPVVGVLAKPFDCEQFCALAGSIESLEQVTAGCLSMTRVEATV